MAKRASIKNKRITKLIYIINKAFTTQSVIGLGNNVFIKTALFNKLADG